MKLVRYLTLAVCLIGSCAISYNLMSIPAPIRKPAAVAKLGSIVRLTDKGRTFCSGTVISTRLILTAAHCVMTLTPYGPMSTASEFNIRDNNNVDQHVLAQPAFVDPQTDHAILVGDFSKFNAKEMVSDPTQLTAIRDSFASKRLVMCGYPLGGALYCTAARYRKPISFFWEVDGVLMPGMSGGPTMVDGVVIATNYAVEAEFSIISPTYNVLENVDKQQEQE